MQRQEITKCLAEKIWRLGLEGEEEGYYINDETGWRIPTYMFDPIHNIAHAFLVVEWMAQQKFYISITYDPFYVSFLWWKVTISGWEQSKNTDERGQDPAYLITLAAFKALAPAELQSQLLDEEAA